MESRRPSRVRKLTQKMSDFAKDEEASLLQLLDGRLRLGTEPDAVVKEERNLSKVSETATALRRSGGRAAAQREHREDEGEEERADWDQFQVHPLDRGKAPSHPKPKRDQSRAMGDAPPSTTSSVDSRQALIDQSIKQHRQLFFGVPVSMQEESFLSLAAISCFFADSDDEGARTKTKERRGRAFMADSDESEDGGLRLSRSAGKRNRQRDKLPHDDVSLSKTSADQGGRKRSFSDVSANDHTVKGKASRRSTSGAPAPAEQKRKEKKDKKRDKKKADKSKRHKAGKVWALDNLPELPGLEYIKANLYKCRKPKLERAMGCECKERCLPCPCRGAQMECCHSSSAEDPCKCSAKCKNQRLTKGKVAPIAVVKTTKKGYGVIADATIKPRSLIIEYVGEVISETEKNRRMKRRDDDGNCYFMELYSQKVSMQRRSFPKRPTSGGEVKDSPEPEDSKEDRESGKAKKKKKSKPRTEEEIRDRKSRKGLKLACSNCRMSHLACSHETPCSRCVEKGMADSCVFIPKRRRRTYQQIEEDKRKEREKEKKKRAREKKKPASAKEAVAESKAERAASDDEEYEAMNVDAPEEKSRADGDADKSVDEPIKTKSEAVDDINDEGSEEEALAQLLCAMPTRVGLFGGATDSDGMATSGQERGAPRAKGNDDGEDEYKDEGEDYADSDDYESTGDEEDGESSRTDGGVKAGAMIRRWYIDAAEKGNAARFINHSCQPNCVVERWQCGEQMRLGIFAAVKIKKGEEITYDYAFQYDYAERDNNKKGKRRECHCGAAECVGKI